MATYLYPAVSVTSLPPLGGATSANQLLEIAELQDINANTAGPVKIRKNGTVQEVNKDTGTPANTVAVPVEIVSASGTTINITAGDINIQTTSEGSNFDSMRIGSGSGFFAAVNTDSELTVHDQGVIDALAALSGSGLATEDKQDDQIAEEQALNLAIGQRADAMATDYFGTFSLISLTKRLGLYLNSIDTQMAGKATEATLALINGKTPALGQALDAASVPVVLTAAQIATLTPPAAITGFATALRQDLQTASLTSIDGKLAGTLTVTQAAPTVTQTDDTQNTDSITTVLFTKPAGAKNMVIFNNAGASVANRIRFGAAPSFASSGTGALLGVGSSTALLPASAFSVIAENTDSNANVTVIWFY